MVQRGSQLRESLEASGYRLESILAFDEVVLVDECGRRDLFVENDDYAGYVVEIDGFGYEFMCSLDAPHEFSATYSSLRMAYAWKGLEMTDLSKATVKRFGYRQAFAVKRFAEFSFRSDDDIYEWRYLLALRCDAQPDNHETYEVTIEGKSIYVTFSDWKAYLGFDIRIMEW
jgi:hypothetical protein